MRRERVDSLPTSFASLKVFILLMYLLDMVVSRKRSTMASHTPYIVYTEHL